ncbi:HPr kinase/phosphorylase [Sinisalibacter aestuarii]|uniref:Aldolase n=1 Tax=Sinisalibacter aestuarii TaxID=2949426 RepID=A0ABQ5LW93_9RHOB|nr:HPr kinase/phosphatase C-terminal domain-containing protein [Sinisalibacter aestuarii]GKY89270.1 aldolase [Sinisalibacter aestuarii]
MTVPQGAPPASETRHASAVAVDGRAVLIEGPSGSGKSGLALDLISRGARLIADDRTRLVLRDGWPWALPPERLAGVIEARGVGLIRSEGHPPAPLTLVVEMGAVETARLPAPRTKEVLGQAILHLRRVDAPHFASAILALLKGGLWHDV